MVHRRPKVYHWHTEHAPSHTCRGLHCSICSPRLCPLAISRRWCGKTTSLMCRVCRLQEEWQDVASPDADDADDTADGPASESQPKAAAAALQGKAEAEMPDADGAAAGQVGSYSHLTCG